MEAKIKYLNFIKRANGTTDVYVRRWLRNCPAIKIEAPIGSTEFLIEYAAAIAKQERITKDHSVQRADTYDSVEWLFKQFHASPEFSEYSPNTKPPKLGRAEHICKAQPRGQALTFGESNYTSLKRSHMYQLRAFAFEDGATEEKDGAPGKANNWIKDCSAVFNWACKYGVAPDHFRNPCIGLGKLKEGPGYHTWTSAQCCQFEDYWPVGTMPRLAYELMSNTGARVSDAHRLGKVHEKKNILTWKPFKGQNVGGDIDDDDALEISIPIRSELRTALDATPSGNLVYVSTSNGTPFQSAKGFSQWFVDQRKSAGLPDECVPHGLRKSAATRLAEAGVGKYMLMSIMGWTNPNQARKYIEKASRAKMAGQGMQMLDTDKNND